MGVAGIGTGLVAMAAVVALMAAAVPDPRWRPSGVATVAGLLAAATGLLAREYLTNSFVLASVADTTRNDLPALVRLSGLWGGPEGSLLLFVAMTAAWLALLRSASRPGLIGLGLASATIVWAASPFAGLRQPLADGSGLQPILEHPAMGYHPPLLYLGLTGALAVGVAAETGERALRAAAALLTLGLASGSAWAATEVGWGGYWAWDPIENGGLVALLVALAVLHGSLRWRSTIAVAAVWATALTRTGLISSVHGFADEPRLRAALLAISGFATVWSAAELWHRRGDSAGPLEVTPPGAVFGAAAAIVALGTYEPAAERLVGGDAVTIAGVYFARSLWPVAIVAGLALAAADLRGRRGLAAGAGAGAVGLGAVAIVWRSFDAAGASPAATSLALAGVGGLVVGAAATRVPARPRALAHLGLGLLLVGVAATTAATTTPLFATADPTPLGATGRSAALERLWLDDAEVGPAAVAEVTVTESDGSATTLRPRIQTFDRRGTAASEVAADLRPSGLLHVSLVDGVDDGAFIRVTFTPLLWLVWLGAAVSAAGLVAPTSFRREQPVDGRAVAV